MIAILGGDGALAREFVRALGPSVVAFSRRACDITDLDMVRRVFCTGCSDYPWSAIINCAAYTQVDQAEAESELAFAVNASGARNAAQAAKEIGARFLHISTDYVFDGRKSFPYTEEDPPAPISVYGRSKLAGELAVRAVGGDWIIVRTGELFGSGRNFFDAVLKRARAGWPGQVVYNQIVSPTWTRDLARNLIAVLEHAPSGLYHCTASGFTSWYNAAREALDMAGLDVGLVEPIPTIRHKAEAARPAYSVLSCDKLEVQGLYRMRPWREALAEWISS